MLALQNEGPEYDVHLTNELSAEGIDNAGYRGCFPLAYEIEIQHALDSPGLKPAAEHVSENLFKRHWAFILYKASRFVVE